jgi:hypothetical protein
MRDEWYVLPDVEGRRSAGETGDELALMLLESSSGGLWPRARSLPRRARGRVKR